MSVFDSHRRKIERILILPRVLVDTKKLTKLAIRTLRKEKKRIAAKRTGKSLV